MEQYEWRNIREKQGDSDGEDLRSSAVCLMGGGGRIRRQLSMEKKRLAVVLLDRPDERHRSLSAELNFRCRIVGSLYGCEDREMKRAVKS